MTYARKLQVSLQDTPFYHVTGRCVRRAWLWGVDQYAGRDYSYRKAWVEERLKKLCTAFAVDVCAYAIMSNHYHLVLHVDKARALGWSRQEVVQRWASVFAVPKAVERWAAGQAQEAEVEMVQVLIERWRTRLHDLSWFMKCLNESLARRANAEDKVPGKFWESRFKSQALLDEAGLLTAMAYVDLNPVRAGIASSPEESQFTSIYARIRELHESPGTVPPTADTRVPLMQFHSPGNSSPAIPYRFQEYLELVDWTGRAVRADKNGCIDGNLPPIVQRLRIDATAWQSTMRQHGNVFGRAIGTLSHLRLHAKTVGQSWVRGLMNARRLYAC